MEQSTFWEADSNFSQSRNFMPFMEPEGSLPYSQDPPLPILNQSLHLTQRYITSAAEAALFNNSRVN
jgi:hypothetical protein